MDGDSIKVFVRVRPPALNLERGSCLEVTSPTSLITQNKNDPKEFTFDHVVGQNTNQETVFDFVGKRIVDGCIEGYNGTIFAYGQTGSGKTYTMLGDTDDFINDLSEDLKGIIPRCLEYLFQLIDRSFEMHGESLEFLCKCSFLEIYHEHIYDLLDSNRSSPLQLRESLQRGIFVDGIIESRVTTASQALQDNLFKNANMIKLTPSRWHTFHVSVPAIKDERPSLKSLLSPTNVTQVLKKGWNIRHVGSTSMNRESSRSHAVFSVCIESKDKTGDVTKVRKSMLNLVDLAGSERQRDTETSGTRLKEAGSINRSLSVFGNVIMSLAEINKGKTRHVPYRDSKLTFLLRDSIGGNARTYVIANVHPSASCFGETLSTLYFAQRAKLIKNRARVNEDAQGDVIALQNEIQRLKLFLAKSKSTELSNLPNELDDYRSKFFEAMEVWRQDATEIDELNMKLTSVQGVVRKLEKALLSMRMIIKFRDATINKLMKKESGNPADLVDADVLGTEIEYLNEHICTLPRAAMQAHRIDELKRSISRLQSLPNARAFVEFSTKRKQALIDDFKKLISERNPSRPPMPENLSIGTGGCEKMALKLRTLETEMDETRKNAEGESNRLREEINSLTTALDAAKFEKGELEKMLKASEEGTRAQLKHLNMMHDNTIRVITTPRKSGKRPLEGDGAKLTPRKLLKRPDGDSFDMDSLDENVDPRHMIGDVHDIDDDVSAVAYKLELESEREEKMRIEKRCQEAEKENISLKQRVVAAQGKFESIQEKLASCQTSSSSKEKKLENDVTECRKKLNDVTGDHQLKCEEVRDLRLALTSADRELAEKKQILKEVQEASQKETSHLRKISCSLKEAFALKSSEVEKLDQKIESLEEDNEKVAAELDFTKQRLMETSARLNEAEDELAQVQAKLGITTGQLSESKRLLDCTQLEREGSLQELTDDNERLRRDIADALLRHSHQEKEIQELKARAEIDEKTIKNNKVAMGGLLEQVNELRGALSLRDISGEEMRSELMEYKEKMEDMEQKLEEYRRLGEEDKQKLHESRQKHEQSEAKYNFQIENLQDDIASMSDHFAVMTREAEDKDKLLEKERIEHTARAAALEKELDDITRSFEDCKSKLKLEQDNENKAAIHNKEMARLRDNLAEQTELYEEMRSSYNEAMRQYRAGRELISQLEVKLEHKDEYTRQLQMEHHEVTEKLMTEQALLESRHHLRLTEATKILEEQLDEAKTSEIMIANEKDNIKMKLDGALEEIRRNEQLHQALVVDVGRLQNVEAERMEEFQQMKTSYELERAQHALAEEKLEAVTEERDILASEAAKLAGHTNHLQKIHYMEKLKNELAAATEEKNNFKSKCQYLTEQLRRYDSDVRYKVSTSHQARKSQSPRTGQR